jgi:MioC protein
LSQPIFILVGTMTGTAEIVAEDVRDMFKESGREAELLLMDDLDPSVFQRQGIFLVCTSTYGQGDVPDNAMKLYNALEKDRPSLSGIRYGVIALGDRAYNETYTHGGQRFDKLMGELGATRIGQVCQHDASGTDVPEEVGVAWARAWLAELDAAGA